MDNSSMKSGQASPEQIEAWKKQYGKVFELDIEDAVGYLRRPTRVELSAATALSANDPVAFNERLLNDCWLGGDERIKTDDEYFFGASPLLAQLVEAKHGELKKI